jgi:hypothetical protein
MLQEARSALHAADAAAVAAERNQAAAHMHCQNALLPLSSPCQHHHDAPNQWLLLLHPL